MAKAVKTVSVPPIVFKWRPKAPAKALRAYKNFYYKNVYNIWVTGWAKHGYYALSTAIPPSSRAHWVSLFDFATGKLKSTVGYKKSKFYTNKDFFKASYGIENTRRNRKFVMSHVEGKDITPVNGPFLWFKLTPHSKKYVRARKVHITKKTFLENSIKEVQDEISSFI